MLAGVVISLRGNSTGGPLRDAGNVHSLGEALDDQRLLAALKAGHRSAQATFVKRYHHYVERLVTRVLGFDDEVPDLVQEVFVGALRGIARFRGDHGALSTWLGQIAIRTARGCIRKRKARRWLDFLPGASLDERPKLEDVRAALFRPEERQAVARTYAALERLSADERLVFVLRIVEGLEVTEVAVLCQISPATVKRRSKRAHERFWRLVERDPVLKEWADARGLGPRGAAEDEP